MTGGVVVEGMVPPRGTRASQKARPHGGRYPDGGVYGVKGGIRGFVEGMGAPLSGLRY